MSSHRLFHRRRHKTSDFDADDYADNEDDDDNNDGKCVIMCFVYAVVKMGHCQGRLWCTTRWMLIPKT